MKINYKSQFSKVNIPKKNSIQSKLVFFIQKQVTGEIPGYICLRRSFILGNDNIKLSPCKIF